MFGGRQFYRKLPKSRNFHTFICLFPQNVKTNKLISKTLLWAQKLYSCKQYTTPCIRKADDLLPAWHVESTGKLSKSWNFHLFTCLFPQKVKTNQLIPRTLLWAQTLYLVHQYTTPCLRKVDDLLAVFRVEVESTGKLLKSQNFHAPICLFPQNVKTNQLIPRTFLWAQKLYLGQQYTTPCIRKADDLLAVWRVESTGKLPRPWNFHISCLDEHTAIASRVHILEELRSAN